MSKINITVKNIPRISLVKLVVTIISVFLARREITFEVATFEGLFIGRSLLLAFANTCEILSLLSGSYFGNLITVFISDFIL